jgi:glycosyltransferase involved in cell wall biosynthesis
LICLLHGYLLEGSGSNLWTRSIVEALCRRGMTVHLMAQENHPERYPFISEARRYHEDGTIELFHQKETETQGRCVLHKPVLGEMLPVYVADRYEEFERVVPMVELGDGEIEDYIGRNVRALERIVDGNGIRAIHANHAVLMPVVAQRIRETRGVPYVVMPHGSALEYAVRVDERMKRYAEEAMTGASKVFVIGGEMRERVHNILGDVPGLEEKMRDLRLGVDTSRFRPIDPPERLEALRELERALSGLDRGKDLDRSSRLHELLRQSPDVEHLRSAIEQTTDYELKAPDADLERKLEQVDWEREKTLIYVGRLIVNKGPQNILAALPLVMETHPELRFVLVGHGPLREVLEALVWALAERRTDLVREILVDAGTLTGESGDSESSQMIEWLRLLDLLEGRGELERYFDLAARHVRPERVIFTGYLTHRELGHLFPCFDAAVFPSLVREAGPLVFLEALASGVFPLGTDFGGMRASIESLRSSLPEEVIEQMKISPEPDTLIPDLVQKLPLALDGGSRWKADLRRAVVENYDWTSIADDLYETLMTVS